MKNLFLLLTLAVCTFILCSCDNRSEANHPMIKKAELLVQTEKYEESILYYKKYLQINPNASAIHLKLALIYDENLGDLVSAIYHYKEYLALSPNAGDKEMVQEWVNLCEKRFLAAKNSNNSTDNAPEIIIEDDELEEPPAQEISQKTDDIQGEKTPIIPEEQVEKVNSATLEEDEAVKTPKVVAVDTSVDVVDTKAEEKSNPPTNSVTQGEYPKMDLVANEVDKKTSEVDKDKFPQYYTVKKGDTLSQISSKFYGTMKYYREIMKANNLANPSDLRAGVRILLPKIEQ